MVPALRVMPPDPVRPRAANARLLPPFLVRVPSIWRLMFGTLDVLDRNAIPVEAWLYVRSVMFRVALFNEIALPLVNEVPFVTSMLSAAPGVPVLGFHVPVLVHRALLPKLVATLYTVADADAPAPTRTPIPA